MYRYSLVFLMLVSSMVVFSNPAIEQIRRRRVQDQIEEHFILLGDMITQEQIVRQPISINRNLDLAPYIQECLCSSCNRVCDCCKTVDDWGYGPLLCCMTVVYCWTGNPYAVASTVGACCVATVCLEPGVMN